VKSVRVGGHQAALEIASMAVAHGVDVVVSNLFETGVGIASALSLAAELPAIDAEDPPDHGLATAGLLEHDLLARSLIVEDGRMRSPEDEGAGGLGIVLDPRALERFRVESAGFGS
jgi:L-alanine-DL-glutamate epimerase-like enolase superfamily enzyme